MVVVVFGVEDASQRLFERQLASVEILVSGDQDARFGSTFGTKAARQGDGLRSRHRFLVACVEPVKVSAARGEAWIAAVGLSAPR
jgi:hypothetical protein